MSGSKTTSDKQEGPGFSPWDEDQTIAQIVYENGMDNRQESMDLVVLAQTEMFNIRAKRIVFACSANDLRLTPAARTMCREIEQGMKVALNTMHNAVARRLTEFYHPRVPMSSDPLVEDIVMPCPECGDIRSVCLCR